MEREGGVRKGWGGRGRTGGGGQEGCTMGAGGVRGSCGSEPSTAVLLAGKAWDTCLDRVNWGEPHGHSPPHLGQCFGWTGPCGSYYDRRTHLSNSHQGTVKNEAYCSEVQEGSLNASDRTARSQVEGGGGGVSAFIRSCAGGLGFWAHCSLANLKHNSRNLGAGREKLGHFLGYSGLSYGEPHGWGQSGSLSGRCHPRGDMCIQDRHLSSGCLHDQKLNVKPLHYNQKTKFRHLHYTGQQLPFPRGFVG